MGISRVMTSTSNSNIESKQTQSSVPLTCSWGRNRLNAAERTCSTKRYVVVGDVGTDDNPLDATSELEEEEDGDDLTLFAPWNDKINYN